MRQWCSCGAAIRGRRRDVLNWARTHACPDRPEPDGDAHIGTGAQVEHAGHRWFDGDNPIVEARIGFRPNQERDDG